MSQFSEKDNAAPSAPEDPKAEAVRSASPRQEKPPHHIVEMAVEVAALSPCQSKRGAVVFRGANVLTHGYNYKPRGFDCDGSAACKATCRCEAIHAEQQALLYAGRQADGCDLLHAKVVDGELVSSDGPSCVECSKLLLVAGIAGVWLYHGSEWHRYPAAEFHAISLQTSSARRRAGASDVISAPSGPTSENIPSVIPQEPPP